MVKPYEIRSNGVYWVCLDSQKSKYTKVLKALKMPSSSACPNGLEPLLKRVVGVPGDIVEANATGVTITGLDIPNSIPVVRYNDISLLPQLKYHHQLLSGEYWVMGNTARSYDSRYFGVVYESEIIAQSVGYLNWNLNTIKGNK